MPELAPLVGHLAYAVILVSFLVRSMAKLRLLSIVASFSAIGYSVFAAEHVLWPPLFWNGVFISINVWQLYLLYQESRVQALSEEEALLHKGALRHFTTFEVRSLVAMAGRRGLAEGERLLTQGERPGRLFLLTGGVMRIEIGGEEIARLGPGSFVGEMGFLTGDPSRADAVAAEASTLYCWEKEQLERWLLGDRARSARMQSALGSQVVGFLMEKSKR